MTPEQLKIYQTHPAIGAEMLKGFHDVSDQVIQIVFQHHERITGDGYPSALGRSKIYPPAKIVAVCDVVSDYLIEKHVNPFTGLKQMMAIKGWANKFEPSVIKALVDGLAK